MPKILIGNLNNTSIEVNDGDKSILDAILNSGVDWMHACGGNGRCTTCKLVVTEGLDNLGPIIESEEKLRELGRLGENERLACQTLLSGNVVANVAEKNKFPHVTYTD